MTENYDNAERSNNLHLIKSVIRDTLEKLRRVQGELEQFLGIQIQYDQEEECYKFRIQEKTVKYEDLPPVYKDCKAILSKLETLNGKAQASIQESIRNVQLAIQLVKKKP